MEYKLIGKSYLAHTGGRERRDGGGVRIGLSGVPDGAVLTVNGHGFPVRGEGVTVDAEVFVTGINRIALHLSGREIAGESILSTGGGLTPAGASLHEVIRSLDMEIERLEERLGRVERCVTALSEEEGLFG